MRKVWVVADGIVSPLGTGTGENFSRLLKGESGVRDFSFPETSHDLLKVAACDAVKTYDGLTRFESLCAGAIDQILCDNAPDPERTLFVLSTTKGNIDLIGEGNGVMGTPSDSAKRLATRYGFTRFQVVSNACISGVLAMITAKRFIESGSFDHAIVVGGDIISRFVVSGFRSLQALSARECRPFDKQRDGINLGEAAAAMLISAEPKSLKGNYQVAFTGEGVTNDANHISGPSRTGEELAMAITRALTTANVKRSDIDFISSHGTATVYNDEMEARAFFLSGLEGVPLNSLKGYYGHTLGAAGILESVISIRSLISNELIGTHGFETRGVSLPVKVAAKTQSWPLRKILKTASGFGGCNAAVVFEK